ncbi:LexA family protein [Rodentibacter haemolyticus]|uniref:Helix-turn-helix domain-containing protein n=1 Tax=Rodentibacter haemolyticus TaxID=2778911 RepID=A0ABX6UYN2_9PAST|nr:XRE family transcriptional regulator [Rodentibacter haemolyticus]QPB42196.1 helix-turn-helix domain-containing protein [Rodentibacter haemolyticus]
MKKQWNEYVRDKMNQSRKKQEDIAEAMGKTQGAIGHWLTGRRTPNFNDVAKMLEVTGEEKVILNSDGTLEPFDENIAPATLQKTYSYPLLSAIQAGTFTETCDYTFSDGYEYLESNIDTEGEGFFLEIKGQSMENKFSEGDLVLIDTGLYPHPGQFVAAVNGNGEATFKQYKELGEISESSGMPHFELVPLNPVFPTLSTLKQDIRIIGVAVEHRRYL